MECRTSTASNYMEPTYVPGTSAIDELVALALKRDSPAIDKLYQFLYKYHLDAPELKYFMGIGAEALQFTEALEKLALATHANSPDKNARGAALYLLADGYYNAANYTATLNGLQLEVDDYLDLTIPDITEERKAIVAPLLRRWKAESWQVLRTKAVQYAKELLTSYSTVVLHAPSIDQNKRLAFVPAGRIGKRAKSIVVSAEKAVVGEPAGELDIRDLDKRAVTSTTCRGKIIILYVWSFECGPCRQSIPFYREMSEKLRAENRSLEVITLSIDDNEEELKQFISGNPMPFTNCRIGSNNRLLHEWRIGFFPTGILLDEHGVIMCKGYFTKKFLMLIQHRIGEYGRLQKHTDR